MCRVGLLALDRSSPAHQSLRAGSSARRCCSAGPIDCSSEEQRNQSPPAGSQRQHSQLVAATGARSGVTPDLWPEVTARPQGTGGDWRAIGGQ